MKKMTYVTGNYGKYISVKEKFEENGIEIDYLNFDIDEPNINNIEIISKEKARIAYEWIKSPVFVIDCGFYIRSYPNNPYYPGAFVKRSGVAKNIDELLNNMANINDRYCYFLDCLTYYDGFEYYHFYGKSEGTLGYESRGEKLKKAKSNLWYVFIPNNYSKTLAEMTDEERKNRNDGSTDATQEFANWIKNNCVLSKNRVLSKDRIK